MLTMRGVYALSFPHPRPRPRRHSLIRNIQHFYNDAEGEED